MRERKILIGLTIIEFILVFWGVSAFAIANYFNYKQDLGLIKERQEGLKIQRFYTNCPMSTEENN